MRLSIRNLSAAILLALPTAVRAVFQDEVGHIDYHYDLLGIPQSDATFFHRPRREDKASLLYTLSDLGVLGAVNPSTGSLVWRQILGGNLTAASENAGFLRAGEDATWIVSALGSFVSAWDAISGRNSWLLEFPGTVKDLEIMELTEGGRKDVLVLFEEDGAIVARRIHGEKGVLVWELRDTSNGLPLQISNNVEKVFVVSLHGSLLSYSLQVTVLDPLTGKRMDEISLGTKGEVQKESDVMFVGANSAAPIVAWTDNTFSKLKINVLGTKSKHEFDLVTDTKSVAIHAPNHPQSQPHFLVHSKTKTANKADIFHVNLKSNAVTKAYDLPLLKGSSAFSISSSNTNVYFTRITPEEVIITSSVSHGILGRWPLKGINTVTSTPLHAVTEVIKKAEDAYAVRLAVVTDLDDWTLIRNGEVNWSRPEGLSNVAAATWAEIPESEDLAKTLEAEAHSNPLEAYIHRLNRHINDLQYLPQFLQSIPARLMGTVLGSDSTKASHKLARDNFGLNKLVIVATRRGKLYALDTGNRGRIVWSKSSREVPGSRPWDVKSIHSDDVKGFTTVRGADGEFIIVQSDSGKTVETMGPGLWPAVQGVADVDSEAGPWLLPIGLEGKIGEVPLKWAPKQTVVVRGKGDEIKGVVFEPEGEVAIEVPSWTFTPGPAQKLVHVATRSRHDPIASIGRILGDRSVKYKYLNLNTMVVAALDEAASVLTVYLLDTVSGQTLYAADFDGVDAKKDIKCAIAENWFTCSFYGEYPLSDTDDELVKGYQLAIFDLYESEPSNDRGPLGDSANYSSIEPVDLAAGPSLPSVVSKTFVIPSPIKALTVTQTRQGITSRQLLAYAPHAQSIVGIPRTILEPRRPVNRDPTPAELEEGLIKYAPVIELDPRMMITHHRQVAGIESVITAPANLESTSLVFAYGIDIFGTRVTPSLAFDVLDKGFNKVALMGTVGALTIGVLVLGPMVRRKQINLRWQPFS